MCNIGFFSKVAEGRYNCLIYFCKHCLSVSYKLIHSILIVLDLVGRRNLSALPSIYTNTFYHLKQHFGALYFLTFQLRTLQFNAPPTIYVAPPYRKSSTTPMGSLKSSSLRHLLQYIEYTSTHSKVKIDFGYREKVRGGYAIVLLFISMLKRSRSKCFQKIQNTNSYSFSIFKYF